MACGLEYHPNFHPEECRFDVSVPLDVLWRGSLFSIRVPHHEGEMLLRLNMYWTPCSDRVPHSDPGAGRILTCTGLRRI